VPESVPASRVARKTADGFRVPRLVLGSTGCDFGRVGPLPQRPDICERLGHE
jgi:hypothetical protein